MKKILIMLCFMISFSNLLGQRNALDSLPEVIFISYVECADFVVVTPKNEDKESRYTGLHGIKLSSFVSYRDSVEAKFKGKKIRNAQYECLRDDGFLLFYGTTDIHKYITPIVNDTLQNRIKAMYPHPFVLIDIKSNGVKEYDGYYVSSIDHKEYILVLVKATLLNEMYKGWLPWCHRLIGEKTLDGIYIKMLVPL